MELRVHLCGGPSHSEGVTRHKAFALKFFTLPLRNQLGEKKRKKKTKEAGHFKNKTYTLLTEEKFGLIMCLPSITTINYLAGLCKLANDVIIVQQSPKQNPFKNIHQTTQQTNKKTPKSLDFYNYYYYY